MTITRFQPGKRMSQAVRHGNTVYLAGQVAADYDGSIEKQTTEVLAAIDRLLAESGTDRSRVLSCQVILNNIGDFAAMNAVYDAWVDPANPPARACIEARLAHPSLKVEIIATAAMPE
jgi:enamine deaminase RidA (YjgF/YER057c/UK114 family)